MGAGVRLVLHVLGLARARADLEAYERVQHVLCEARQADALLDLFRQAFLLTMVIFLDFLDRVALQLLGFSDQLLPGVAGTVDVTLCQVELAYLNIAILHLALGRLKVRVAFLQRLAEAQGEAGAGSRDGDVVDSVGAVLCITAGPPHLDVRVGRTYGVIVVAGDLSTFGVRRLYRRHLLTLEGAADITLDNLQGGLELTLPAIVRVGVLVHIFNRANRNLLSALWAVEAPLFY